LERRNVAKRGVHKIAVLAAVGILVVAGCGLMVLGGMNSPASRSKGEAVATATVPAGGHPSAGRDAASSPALTAMPEPVAVGLLVLGVLLVPLWHRRQRRYEKH